MVASESESRFQLARRAISPVKSALWAPNFDSLVLTNLCNLIANKPLAVRCNAFAVWRVSRGPEHHAFRNTQLERSWRSELCYTSWSWCSNDPPGESEARVADSTVLYGLGIFPATSVGIASPSTTLSSFDNGYSFRPAPPGSGLGS